MRYRLNEQVILVYQTQAYLTTIKNILEQEIRCQIVKIVPDILSSNLKYSLVCLIPLLKPKNFEKMLSVITELGGTDIVPVQFDRCQIKLNSNQINEKFDR
jgi:RsmE family RNA methyltransferase